MTEIKVVVYKHDFKDPAKEFEVYNTDFQKVDDEAVARLTEFMADARDRAMNEPHP